MNQPSKRSPKLNFVFSNDILDICVTVPSGSLIIIYKDSTISLKYTRIKDHGFDYLIFNFRCKWDLLSCNVQYMGKCAL